jgi:hypothetical protein
LATNSTKSVWRSSDAGVYSLNCANSQEVESHGTVLPGNRLRLGLSDFPLKKTTPPSRSSRPAIKSTPRATESTAARAANQLQTPDPGVTPRIEAEEPDLIDPEIVSLMRLIAAGKLSEVEARPPWKVTSPAVPREFLPFLQSSGDFPKLAAALKTTPSLLWHPITVRIIGHLREIRGDEEFSHAAQGTLVRLLEAAVSGLLFRARYVLNRVGDWSLTPPRERPGRKARSPENIDLELLHDSGRLMTSLEQLDLRRQKGESDEERARRVAPLLKQVWEQSPSLSTEYVGSEKIPGSDDPLAGRLIYKAVPAPPDSTLITWVKRAYQNSSETGRSARAQLVWKMLAYRYDLKARKVRYEIDVAKAWLKEQT